MSVREEIAPPSVEQRISKNSVQVTVQGTNILNLEPTKD